MAKSLLRDPKIQANILADIRHFGVEEATSCAFDGSKIKWACYDNIVSSTAYYKYKAAHPDFAAKVDDAKAYYRQTLVNMDVQKRQALIDAIERECREGYITTKTRTKRDEAGNVIEIVEETIKQPPREFLFRVLLWNLDK